MQKIRSAQPRQDFQIFLCSQILIEGGGFYDRAYAVVMLFAEI